MKKYLLAFTALIALTVSTPTESHAQKVKLTDKTITAADTLTLPNVPSKIKSFTYYLLKTSGTVAGKVYFYGSNISGAWDLLDSLTLANVSTVQTKTTIVTATSYRDYRWINTNTSSATCAVTGGYLRRDDE